MVDVITNSSTTIYTNQDDSVQPAKELVSEMLKLFGVTNLTPDDIFEFRVVKEDEDYSENDSSELMLTAKDSKYDDLARKMIKFLNSTDYEEGYD
jgi:hypothetical protein